MGVYPRGGGRSIFKVVGRNAASRNTLNTFNGVLGKDTRTSDGRTFIVVQMAMLQGQ